MEQPSLEEIANHVNLSKYHFQRVFKKWVGISPKDYLQFITLEKAKESLRKGQSTLETSYNIGLSGNSRLQSLRIYDKNGMMIDVKTLEGNEIRKEIESIFSNDLANYIQIHNANPGCYNCQVNRME